MKMKSLVLGSALALTFAASSAFAGLTIDNSKASDLKTVTCNGKVLPILPGDIAWQIVKTLVGSSSATCSIGDGTGDLKIVGTQGSITITNPGTKYHASVSAPGLQSELTLTIADA